MNYWQEDEDSRISHVDDLFDPLCVERSAPLGDEEAALIETLCQASTPGPLVVGDGVEAEGTVVAMLSDGRVIVSLTAAMGGGEDDSMTHANSQLICKARYLLLRLLRDRQQWKEQREFLKQRIRTLETALGIEKGQARRSASQPAEKLVISPR